MQARARLKSCQQLSCGGSCLHSPSASVHNDVTTVAHQSVERTSAHPCMVQHGHVTARDRPSASSCDGVRTVRRRCRSSPPLAMSKGRTRRTAPRSHAQLQIPLAFHGERRWYQKGESDFCVGAPPRVDSYLNLRGYHRRSPCAHYWLVCTPTEALGRLPAHISGGRPDYSIHPDTTPTP